MARFDASSVDKYGGQGGAGYFSLKGDGDTAYVRFLYDTADDIEGYAVHEVEIDGKKRYVNCLREYNQSVDDCPFCKAKKFQVAKLFVPLYNEDEQKVQVWERGKKFFAKMSGICARYNKAPIVAQTFEIQRNGKPGDTSTTYEIYRSDEPADDTKLEDFEYFPPDGEAPVRRSTNSRDTRQSREMPVRRSGRRTPASHEEEF